MNRTLPPAVPALLGLVAVALLLVVPLWAWPQYRVYSQEMRGRARLAEAGQDRQIAVLDAEAEVARARGVAEANKIIGRSLEGNDAYLRYLWIQNLNSGQGERIYIPTEAGLPILEARPAQAPPPSE
ncbi:MAG TPA: hypothetical protein VF576_01510 [Rubricoccaceae bacterium]|jgi:2-hydroxychromene-2-carboxylate isomerase